MEISKPHADGETRTRNPSVINRVLQLLSLTAQKAGSLQTNLISHLDSLLHVP